MFIDFYQNWGISSAVRFGSQILWVPCILLSCQQGVSKIRLAKETLCLFEAAYKAVLQFVVADILEPVGQQNGEAMEMYQNQQDFWSQDGCV